MVLHRLNLALIAALLGGCTVLNDMSAYSGGVSDTGTAAADSNAPDTTPPPDTRRDDGVDALADSGSADTSVAPADSGLDSASADTGVDTTVLDTGTLDTGTDTLVDSGVTDSTADTTPPADAPVGCHVVINEVQTRSSATGFDELIELYNPCDVEISIAGWKLAYRSAAGTSETVLIASLPATAKISAKGFFQIGNAAGTYAATSDATYTSGIGDDAGLAIRDSGGTIIDSVAYGAVAASHPFIEKAAAPTPSAGASISRKTLGVDTNDNSADFVKTSPPTPKSG